MDLSNHVPCDRFRKVFPSPSQNSSDPKLGSTYQEILVTTVCKSDTWVSRDNTLNVASLIVDLLRFVDESDSSSSESQDFSGADTDEDSGAQVANVAGVKTRRRAHHVVRLLGAGSEAAGAKLARHYSDPKNHDGLGQKPVSDETLAKYASARAFLVEKAAELHHIADWKALISLHNSNFNAFSTVLRDVLEKVATRSITGSDSSLRHFCMMLNHYFTVRRSDELCTVLITCTTLSPRQREEKLPNPMTNTFLKSVKVELQKGLRLLGRPPRGATPVTQEHHEALVNRLLRVSHSISVCPLLLCLPRQKQLCSFALLYEGSCCCRGRKPMPGFV